MAGRTQADPGLFRKQLTGRTLTVARVAWLAVVVPTLALCGFGFAVGFSDLTLLGPRSVLEGIAEVGVEPIVAVVAGLVMPLVMVAVLGVVMFWKHPSDPMVLLTSLMLITMMAASTRSMHAAVSSEPALRGPVWGVSVLALCLLALVFALFPNGHPVPRRALVLAPLLAVLCLVMPDLPTALASFNNRPDGFDETTWRLYTAILIGVMSFAVICQVYRYRAVSNTVERLQAKWVIFPLAVMVALVAIFFILSQPVFAVSHIFAGWAHLLVIPPLVLFPVGFAAAILRYRLYDIERIISRTVQYALVVGLLALVYLPAVTLLTHALPVESDMAVAGSTLVVVALFAPLRRLVRTAVDRRFNRTRYTADQELASFAFRVRDTTSLMAIESDVASVIERTLEPSVIGIWLAPPTEPG